MPFRSLSSLKAIKTAMVVDEKNWPTQKAATRIMTRKKTLTLNVQTDNISFLRAVLNTNLRLLLTWRRIVDALG